MEDERKLYKVTYKVSGTITVPILAISQQFALEEAAKEYPESDINYNHLLDVIDRTAVSVEGPDGSVEVLE